MHVLALSWDTLGWHDPNSFSLHRKKKTLTTNKRFINAVVCGTVSSNRRQMAKDEYKTDTRERKDRERKWRDEDIKREKEGRKREDKREKVKDKRSHRHGQSPS